MNVNDRMGTLPTIEPTPEPELSTYWDATREDKLMLARCGECGLVPWPPRPFCPDHPRTSVEWFNASGSGRLYSWTRVHRGEGAFSAAPYVLAYVELEEGPRVLSNVLAAEDEELNISQPVTAVFDQRPSAGAVLRFATAAATRKDGSRADGGSA